MRLAGWGTRRGRLLERQGPALLGAWALFALNLADAGLTAIALSARLAREANPLMRLAWEASPWLFFAVKLALVGGAIAVLVRYREHLAAGVTLYAGLGAYAVVVGYHLAWYGTLLLSWAARLPS